MAKVSFRNKQDLIKMVNAEMMTNHMLSYTIPEFYTTVTVKQGDGKYIMEHIVGNGFEKFPRKIGFFNLIEMLWKDKEYISKSVESKRIDRRNVFDIERTFGFQSA